MLRIVIKRVLRSIVTIIAAAAVVFTILYFAPSDGAECILAKPVIYLYPQEETQVRVTLEGVELETTYPRYDGGWEVLAQPDGTLTDLADGREYSYLFWDGRSDMVFDFSQGFCIPGEDTAAFLQETLEQMGLTPREYNEFIVYWLPLMEGSKYNLISFQGKDYTETVRLDVSPEPDSLLRVFMAWKELDAPVDIEPQTFYAFERQGLPSWSGAEQRYIVNAVEKAHMRFQR